MTVEPTSLINSGMYHSSFIRLLFCEAVWVLASEFLDYHQQRQQVWHVHKSPRSASPEIKRQTWLQGTRLGGVENKLSIRFRLNIGRNLTGAQSKRFSNIAGSEVTGRKISRRVYYIPWAKSDINPALVNVLDESASRYWNSRLKPWSKNVARLPGEWSLTFSFYSSLRSW